ncbi:MAG: glycine--tRNA ligase subunit beta [Peptococcaceae bacterium]|nr:glycine--tRNA ligase subunit beta [Peptococcaceae bacterium]
MADFILEIGLEEMPAAYIDGAVKELADNAQALFDKERLVYADLDVYSTPRRLVLYVQGFAEMQKDLSEEVKGPSVKAAYKDGEAAKPLQGFLRANGFTEADVYTKTLANGDYVFCKREEKGQPTKEILANVLADLILNMKFPKSMHWGSSEIRYLRPIRWILSLYENEVIPCQVENIHADRYTNGHRTLGHAHVEVPAVADYFSIMEAEYVIVDQKRRQKMIEDQIAQIFAGTDEHYQEDKGLLNEIVNLVEYPTALKGQFGTSYLDLPDELVITPMKEHQRYFPVLKNDGTLTNGFITVRNGSEKYLDVVRQGNENVLRARLADAEFFYNEDLKKGLESGEEKLKNIVFQEKLGTIYEKTQRLQYIAEALAKAVGEDATVTADAVTAARCTKMDLVSNVVSEFPELQGIMGEYYYDHEHPDKKNIGQAIREHYMPRYANDNLPASEEGSLVSVADKLDTIVGCFYAGIIPTGSQDPYALRRQALGLANIVIARKWSVSLKELIQIACAAYKQTGLEFTDAETADKIVAFFEQRVLKVLKDANVPADVIQATMKAGYDDFYQTVCRADALQAFMADTDAAVLKATLDNNGRAANITVKHKAQAVDTSLLNAPEEKALYQAVEDFSGQQAEDIANKNYGHMLEHYTQLNDTVEKFFEKILVMDEDDTIRQNRLSLVKGYADVLDDYYKLDELKLS